MKLKNIKLFLITALLSSSFGSCNYLNVVPDNTVQITTMFENKEKAYSALSGCYCYMPNPSFDRRTLALAGGEYTTIYTSAYMGNVEFAQGEKIILGQNSPTSPLFDYWSSWTNNYQSLYMGIRYCNIFLDNIHLVPDLSPADKSDWKAQVLVLKAYYHYYLTMLYGPIVLVTKNFEASDPVEDIRQKRKPVEECFNYAVDLIDQAILPLPPSRSASFLGQVDRTVALALKAKILLTAASPLFNGNSEYYGNFRNEDGTLLFNQQYDQEKWGKALLATQEAIEYAEGQGRRELYKYNESPYDYDKAIWNTSEIIKPVYNCRMSIVKPWNTEVVWGYSGISTGENHQVACQMRDDQMGNNGNFGWNFLGANFSMLELFQTKNGVPINEDRNFEYYDRMSLTTVPIDNYHQGFMQPGRATIKLNLNREPRFYAWLAFDGSKWRDFNRVNDMQMRYNEKNGAQISSPENQYFAGIAIKKWVHPESGNNSLASYVFYPAPIIRMAELYLMYAEASNEYLGPNQDAYDHLNAVRERAGLSKVENVYSDPAIVYQVGKHLSKVGLRDIIQKERMIELCFEDQRYHDLRRWKLAHKYFQGPITGFTISKSDPVDYYKLRSLAMIQFVSPRDYLFPIKIDEMNTNPNLVQNPGW